MTDDRREVSKGEFIKAMVEWIDSQDKNDGVLTITAGGEPVLEIKAIGLTHLQPTKLE